MTVTPLSDDQARELLSQARLAAEHAYAPYSEFHVGAALLTASGEIYRGVNVENASYGLTMCAERVALGKAVSEGLRSFSAIAVWATRMPNGAVTPCGACRQVMGELMGASGQVILSDAETGAPRRFTMAQLLPEAFGLPAERYTGSNTPGDAPLHG
jgi:cytidine deaminase